MRGNYESPYKHVPTIKLVTFGLTNEIYNQIRTMTFFLGQLSIESCFVHVELNNVKIYELKL